MNSSTAAALAGPNRLGDVYLSRDEIGARVRELGAEISRDYATRDLLLVTVLRGAVVFGADLSRSVVLPHALDFVSLVAFGRGPETGARFLKDLDTPIEGRDVLLVENVVDTGLTLNYLLKSLALRGARDLAICTLLDRPARRLCDDLPIRYVGFTAPDEFLVGYGFELDGRYRGLPDLHLLGA